MRAVTFEGYDVVIGRGQDYLPLPCHVQDGIATSCWQLDEAELAEIIRTRRIWVQVLKGDAPQQLMRLLTDWAR